MLEEIRRLVHQGESFAFETTLSGRCYAMMIPRWRGAGYHVTLIFLSLPTADVAAARVAARVAQGGHPVDEQVIRRRFDSGLANYKTVYRGIVDSWALYDNSGRTPELLESGDNADAS